MNRSPARLAIVLQTGDIGAEERRKLAATSRTLALIAHLIVEDIRLDLDTLVDLAVLQLHEAGRDGRDVALLVGEGHAAGSLRVLELRVGVDARVAHAAVESVHDHGQLDGLERSWYSAYEYRLARVEWLRAVHDEV